MIIPRREIHPFVRLFSSTAFLIGGILCENLYILSSFYFIIVIPYFIAVKLLKKHLKFLVYAICPLFVILFFIYAYILPVTGQITTIIGMEKSVLIVLKLLCYTSIFQFLLNLDDEMMIHSLRKWGLSNNLVIIFLGSISVWVELNNRADKIITARLSRGYMNNRSIWTRIKQIPFVIKPLVIGAIRTAIERASSWDHKNILLNFNNIEASNLIFPKSKNIPLFFFSITWLIINILIFIK